MFKTIILTVDEETLVKAGKSILLHEISFQPLIKWIINATSNSEKHIIISDGCTEQLRVVLGDSAEYAEQKAGSDIVNSLISAKPHLENFKGDVFVIRGNTPLILSETINAAYEFHVKSGNYLTVLSSIEHDNVSISKFKFKTDYNMFFMNLNFFANFLKSDSTDIDEFINGNSNKIGSYVINDSEEFAVTNNIQLAKAQFMMNSRIVRKHLLNGVTFLSPETAYIGKDVEIGIDTIIMPNTIIKGKTKIGSKCIIGANTQITDSVIDDNVEINSSVILESSVGKNTKVGPFAYIRPNSKIGENIKIGDFVEIKNSTIDDGTKVSHLTYVGDADVGKNVNFGCGTVLVNYDGNKKHRSTIEDNAFIGCNTNIVSPVNVKQNAFIAAGSTITDEVPENSLAIARARQVVKTDWKRKR